MGRAGAIWVHFDRCAVQAKAIDRDADHVMFLQRGKQAIQHARVCPTPHSGVDSVPIPKPQRQSAPFAAVLRDK